MEIIVRGSMLMCLCVYESRGKSASRRYLPFAKWVSSNISSKVTVSVKNVVSKKIQLQRFSNLFIRDS